MNSLPPIPLHGGASKFRFSVAAAMMAVVVILTAAGLLLAERDATGHAEQAISSQFQNAMKALQNARETRSAALTMRCLSLVRKSRIHAALEDDALDLLYVSAREELLDLMTPVQAMNGTTALHAKFYRFLDARGQVIAAPADDVGSLSREEATRLALPGPQDSAQLGYLARTGSDGTEIFDEVITTPIRSTATHRPIAALAVGFATEIGNSTSTPADIRRGLWCEQRLHLPGASTADLSAISDQLQRVLTVSGPTQNTLVELGGVPHLMLCHQLNAGSRYPLAFEVSLYSLASNRAQLHTLRMKILFTGGLLILVGLAVTPVVAARLSRPVEKMEIYSQANTLRRQTAEASLRSTQVELQRAARFSADASHQLKTPVAVLRAGLQELLAREDLTPPVRTEISTLLNETHRYTGMIEDLLLLSRMDAGRLAIEFTPVDISHLVASWFDDLSLQDDELGLSIHNLLPPTLLILGERRYTWHILANLLENARRYNRPGGSISIAAQISAETVRITIGNTGRTIPVESQPHIFERFHRGGASSSVPGHGLGLNLARELAHLHGGELHLTSSRDDWTEFAATFRLAVPNQRTAV